MNRRQFLAASAALAGAVTAAAQTPRTVRVGVIGTGGRGRSLIHNLVRVAGVEIPAVCDIDRRAAAAAASIVTRAGQPEPERYVKNEHDYKRLLEREDLDGVIIATPWGWHTPMAVDAMKSGKYVGVEVPAALTVDECWQLVDTCEETGMPCMMLENWSFRRDNLAVLRMIRAGLLGQMVHCHCAHSHDCIDHWFFDPQGNDRWAAKYLIHRNCDQYPTHSLGPVLSWLDINCGDCWDTLASTATGSFGINAYFARRFGPDHPSAKREYAQGDIVTSTIKTHGGKTIVVNYDMQLPRPYDNRWMVQGTLGIYNEQREAVYLEGRSPEYHQWEPFEPYQDEFDHPWYTDMGDITGGHGGTDYLELSLWVRAVRDGTDTPLDVYDSATMSSVVGLSAESIEKGSIPIKCPDFTRGRWRTREPYFAVV